MRMLQNYVKSVNLSHVNREVHKTIQANLVSCVNRGKDLVSVCAQNTTLIYLQQSNIRNSFEFVCHCHLL